MQMKMCNITKACVDDDNRGLIRREQSEQFTASLRMPGKADQKRHARNPGPSAYNLRSCAGFSWSG